MESSRLLRKLIFLSTITALIILAGCNLPRSESATTPKLDVTQAYQTIEARLTQTIESTRSLPSPIHTDSGILSSTPSPSASNPSLSPTTTPTSKAMPTTLCDMAAPGNPIDVTIPDDTLMQPGDLFTKIWRLKNNGTCTWTKDYSATFFSGEQMSAPNSVPLAGDVAPGQSLDISIDMTAPLDAGKFQGNWKLRNTGNVLFGIGPHGSAPFWVRIEVVHTPTPTSSPIIPTPTNTSTPTPVVKISGTSTLNINDTLDLDTNQLNTDSGEDLKYTVEDGEQNTLSPLGNTIIGVYGQIQPKLADCQTINLVGAAIIIDTTPISSYLCYQTGAGRLGRIQLAAFDADNEILTVNILTWSLPSE